MKNIVVFFVLAFSVNAYAAPHGDELYATYCSSCHGVDGKGGVGVPIALPSFLNSVSDTYLSKTIRSGRPGRIMPSFETLSDAQVSAIVSHVRSWSDKPAPEENSMVIKGDAEHGAQIYEKFCSQCHGDKGSGGKGTGVTFSRKRELPIIAPALSNVGFLMSASDVMIRDTITFGREGTPMTSMLVAGLSEKDIDDVVAYIRSLEKPAAELQKSLNGVHDEPFAIIVDSPYGLDETIENLKQAITDQNFTLIRTDYLEHGLVDEGKENKKQVVLHFCNFGFLFEALTIDPRIGMFLPCRVTVIEKDGKVQLTTINPKRLSLLFNNHELDESCNEMYELYSTLLEDATL
ncbi:MAG: c-type cytochrome [Gammaproteobacteria bacterium]|nr:c-type cytochrome [Gammaproteobacteria bacterium]